MDIIVASTKEFMANPKESCEINLSKNLEWSTWEGHFGNLGDTSWSKILLDTLNQVIY